LPGTPERGLRQKYPNTSWGCSKAGWPREVLAGKRGGKDETNRKFIIYLFEHYQVKTEYSDEIFN
jgi:hypothetical protein